MKVYVVESGLYENKGIIGVYSTPERAMEANPPRLIPADYVRQGKGDATRSGGWQKDKYGWSNGLDWDECKTIMEFELDE